MVLSHLISADAQKSGVARETGAAAKQAVGKAGQQMTAQEAQMILEVPRDAGWGEVVKVRVVSRSCKPAGSGFRENLTLESGPSYLPLQVNFLPQIL
jgi:hypothetical protein